MSLVLDPSGRAIAFGDVEVPVLPERGDIHEHVCEAHPDVDFAEIENVRGSKLPQRVRIGTHLSSPKYPYANVVEVTRHDDKVRICVSCGYYFDKWREQVHLKDYHEHLASLLNESEEALTVETVAEYEFNQVYVDIFAGFPSSRRLSYGYEKLVSVLLAKHTQTLNTLSASSRELAIAGGLVKFKPYAGKWFEIDLPRLARKLSEWFTRRA